MNGTLHLQCLGGFALRVGDGPVALGGVRLQALLTYLALHAAAPQSRLQLAARFWPEASDAQGRNNLRQLLHHLRQAWPEHEEWIDSDARAMQWRSDPRSRVDAVEFEREFVAARAMGSGERGTAREKLTRIVGTYAGDLLPDCYDEWIVPHRERLHAAALGALDLAVRLAEEQHDHPAAVAHAEHVLRLDPLEERAYLRLMRLHALDGDHAAARRVYTSCVATLQRELGVAPGPEIRDAHARLMRRHEVLRLGTRDPSSTARWSRGGDAAGGACARMAEAEASMAEVQPRAPVLALVTGEAGLGKTRLGEEMLEWADAQGIAVARTRAYAAEGRLAFSPVTGWLRSGAVRESLARLDPLWRTEAARLVSELLRGAAGPAAPGASRRVLATAAVLRGARACHHGSVARARLADGRSAVVRRRHARVSPLPAPLRGGRPAARRSGRSGSTRSTRKHPVAAPGDHAAAHRPARRDPPRAARRGGDGASSPPASPERTST